jgi:hypothetical protein
MCRNDKGVLVPLRPKGSIWYAISVKSFQLDNKKFHKRFSTPCSHFLELVRIVKESDLFKRWLSFDIAPSKIISVGAMIFALGTKLGWRKAIIVIIGDYVYLCIVQIGINVFAMNKHIHAGWNSSGCITMIELVDHFVLRSLPHLSFSEDLHQYLESYGAPKIVALLGGESHFGKLLKYKINVALGNCFF